MKVDESYNPGHSPHSIATVSFDDNRNGSEALMKVETLINALETYRDETHEEDVTLRVAPLEGHSDRVGDYENAVFLTREDSTRLGRLVCPAVRMEESP